MNTATTMVLRRVEERDYENAHSIIRQEGRMIASGECGITYHQLGDDVLCVCSHTQIQYAGSMSHKPYFALPRHARLVTTNGGAS